LAATVTVAASFCRLLRCPMATKPPTIFHSDYRPKRARKRNSCAERERND
jgi:hypothetical protein